MSVFLLLLFLCHSPHPTFIFPLVTVYPTFTFKKLGHRSTHCCTLELHWCKDHPGQCKNHSGKCRDCSVWYQTQDAVALALDTWDMECTGRTWYKMYLQRNEKSVQYLNPRRAVIQGRLEIPTCKLTDNKHVDYPSNPHLEVQSSRRGIGSIHRQDAHAKKKRKIIPHDMFLKVATCQSVGKQDNQCNLSYGWRDKHCNQTPQYLA